MSNQLESILSFLDQSESKTANELNQNIQTKDIDALGAVRLKDVDAAQSLIVDTARKMAQAGEIEILSETDETEEMID